METELDYVRENLKKAISHCGNPFVMRWAEAGKQPPSKEGYYLAYNVYEKTPKVYWWGVSPISSDQTKRKWRTDIEGVECFAIVVWAELPPFA